MIRNAYPFFLIFSFILLTNKINGQVFWKMNGETGYFYSDANTFTKFKNNLLIRLDGEAGYKYDQPGRTASVSLKLRPMFYGIENNLSAIRGRINGNYYYEFEKLGWNTDVTGQHQVYNYNELSAKYTFTSIRSGLTFFFDNGYDLSAELGYSAYDIKVEGVPHSQDLTFINLNLTKTYNPYLTSGFGLYFERFINKSLYLTNNNTKSKNRGYLAGPEVSLKYLKSFVFISEYRFLLLNSDFTSYPSYEHLVRLMAGKSFSTSWTAFILLDYYSRKLKVNEKNNNSLDLLYTPLNLESYLYLKLGYDLKDNIELYAKYGYSKENLFTNDWSVSGWNLMLGIGIKNID